MDDLSGVHLVREHLVKLVDEVTIVNETRLLWGCVPVDQLSRLSFGQIHSKGANASAELS